MTMTMAAAPVLVRIEGDVARVVLNRPDVRNAVNLAMCIALRETFQALDCNDDVRLILLEAKGPVFCAGADLKERQDKDEGWVRQRRLASFGAYEAIERCRKPVVAVIDGAVIGSGGEISMSCDFIVASTATTFRFPEPQWGTIGATQRLQRVIGKRRAKELLFTGRTMPIEEAYALGLVARVAAPKALAETVQQIAKAIVAAPPLAIVLTKQAVDLGEETNLSDGIRIEMAAIERNLADSGWRRGLAHFSNSVGSHSKIENMGETRPTKSDKG